MITPLPLQTKNQKLHDATKFRVLLKHSMLQLVTSRENFSMCSIKTAIGILAYHYGCMYEAICAHLFHTFE